MRPITFVCGTPHGGALESTRSLCTTARSAGHPVRLLVMDGDPYTTWRRTTGALEKANRAAPTLARAGWRVFDAATSQRPSTSTQEQRVANLTGTLARSIRPGELIVVNSVRGLELGRIAAFARGLSTPLVWYLREETSLAHLQRHASNVDLVLANSIPLARRVEELTGRRCPYVPSVISVDGLKEPDRRTTVLLVNAVSSHGTNEVLAMAALAPQRHFVLQESWPLDSQQLHALIRQVGDQPNVEIRRRTDRDRVFRDARVMVAPYAPEVTGLSRPRVALESQYLGIPLIAYATDGLSAVAASPDLLLPIGSDEGLWVSAMDRVDADFECYSRTARAFAAQEVPGQQEVWRRFVDACAPVVDV